LPVELLWVNLVLVVAPQFLGFTKVSEEESGLTPWELLASSEDLEGAPMKVVSQGFITTPGRLLL
jgi:hypothetical protein